jgi:hypothetical protein
MRIGFAVDVTAPLPTIVLLPLAGKTKQERDVRQEYLCRAARLSFHGKTCGRKNQAMRV